MAATSQQAAMEWVIRLLVFLGGVGTTVAGSWISSKIHGFHENKKAHLEDIKRSVLVPIRKEFEQFEPYLFHRDSLFRVEHGTKQHREKARITDTPVEEGVILTAAFPTGWLFRGTEPALGEDSRRNHFREITGALDKFVAHWVNYAGECQFWVNRMAREILERSDLPEFPNQAVEHGIPTFYVMHSSRPSTTVLGQFASRAISSVST